jgi:hypothetical protein
VLSALLSALYGTEAALSATAAAQKANEALQALAAHYTPKKNANNSAATTDDDAAAKHELPPFTTQLDAAVAVTKVKQLEDKLKNSLRSFFQKHHRYTTATACTHYTLHPAMHCNAEHTSIA